MKTKVIAVAVLPTLFIASCLSSDNEPPIRDLIRKHREKSHPPLEAEWNRAGVWLKVSEEPSTYIPVGYPLKAPRSEATGDWFEDKRDGKRLFVPANGVAGLSESILRAEAIKATTVRETILEFEHPLDSLMRGLGPTG